MWISIFSSVQIDQDVLCG